MANRLEMARIQAIVTLYRQGWSCRRIGRELGIHRETVSRYVRLLEALERRSESKPATAPIGSDDVVRESVDVAKDVGVPSPSADPIESPGSWDLESWALNERLRSSLAAEASGLARSSSDCRVYHARIVSALEAGLTAVRIHQDLVSDHGQVAPSYHSVRRYVKNLRQSVARADEPYRRIEVAPGLEAQVDFGRGAPVERQDATGQVRRFRPHVLRVVLSHSRKGYCEVVQRQTTENFIRALENAFWHFGGVPQTLVLDNLRAAVSKADWFEPELNPKVEMFCRHYGIVALPTRPYMPRHKGKVERGVAYVQDNALKGRRFKSMIEQNAYLADWEASVADTRLHGTTRRQVRELFEQVERPALRPLPECRFPTFEEGRRLVHRDAHIEVAKAYYSVPPEFVRRQVWARWDSRVVRIYDLQMQRVCTHVRKEPGQFSTKDEHILDRKIAGVERSTTWLLGRIDALMGRDASQWAQAVVQTRGIQGHRVLQGLLGLSGKHPGDQINRACRIAREHQAFRLRTIRQLLQRSPQPVHEQLPLLDQHLIIRSLADYSQLVHDSFLQPLTENAR